MRPSHGRSCAARAYGHPEVNKEKVLTLLSPSPTKNFGRRFARRPEKISVCNLRSKCIRSWWRASIPQFLLLSDRVAAFCETCGRSTSRLHDHSRDVVLLPSGAAAIRLTRGKHALVDSVGAERVTAAGPCSTMCNGRWWYAISSSVAYLHRLVLGINDSVLVDHENRDTLDCRRENLRRASHSQNTCNHAKKRYAGGTSSNSRTSTGTPAGAGRKSQSMVSGTISGSSIPSRMPHSPTMPPARKLNG